MTVAHEVYDATWGRLFAALYDRSLKATEEGGLGEMRRQLLAGATGRVLELGAGTGVNLDHYPPAVSELVLVEPDPHMAKRLRARLRASPRRATVLESPGERLPFADGEFDLAVATLVLCTVPDPTATLAELRRVLAPGGRLLLIEHVRAGDRRLARWQDRLQTPWRFLADGCHCNRDTAASLAAAGFDTAELQAAQLPKAPPIVRPLIHGQVTAP
ncbi:MAG: class I SAM-dependent methyltransferase [Solirubrobacterales bacterium]